MRHGGQRLAWSLELEAHICVLERSLRQRGGSLRGGESGAAERPRRRIRVRKFSLALLCIGCATLGTSLDLTGLPSLICQMEIIIGTPGNVGRAD